MFTGLIEERGEVRDVKKVPDGIILEIKAGRVLEGTSRGDSICINGACQTVTGMTEDSFSVFVSRVTAEVTTLGSFRKGTRVNLERALLPGSRLGGHIVQGHVDGTGTIKKAVRDASGMTFEIGVPAEMARYIAAKGSVAVDGISLTVVSLVSGGFTLYLIPETLENTEISAWTPAGRVNIEVDILSKYIEQHLKHDAGESERDLKRALLEEGFM